MPELPSDWRREPLASGRPPPTDCSSSSNETDGGSHRTGTGPSISSRASIGLASAQNGTLVKLDPTTGKTLAVERARKQCCRARRGEGSVWVAVRGGKQRPNGRGYPVVCRRRRASSHCSTAMWGISENRLPTELRQLSQLIGRFMTTDEGDRAGYSGYFWERRVAGELPGARDGRTEGRPPPMSATLAAAPSGSSAGAPWRSTSIGWSSQPTRFRAVPSVGSAQARGSLPWSLKGERGTFTFLGPGRERIILR